MEKIRQSEGQSAWKGEPIKEGGQQSDTVRSWHWQEKQEAGSQIKNKRKAILG